jgi:hypothetical protein
VNAKFVSFDCAKVDLVTEKNGTGRCSASAPSGELQGIRAWNSGGPEGSVWNAGDLSCRARVDIPCTGDLDVALKVGRVELVHVKLAKASGSLHCSFELPRKRWSAELDRAGSLPFQTGIFRAEAYVVCQDPPAVLRANDHFVAGFAWGE